MLPEFTEDILDAVEDGATSWETAKTKAGTGMVITMSEIDKEPFNQAMDKELLKNDFAYYDDWEYGPMTGWQLPWEYYILKLMKHDYGYNLIIGHHASGENPTMGIGSSNNAAEIIAIRDALKKLW